MSDYSPEYANHQSEENQQAAQKNKSSKSGLQLTDNRSGIIALQKGVMQRKHKVKINDDAGLEKEADVMGAKALNLSSEGSTFQQAGHQKNASTQVTNAPIQGAFIYDHDQKKIVENSRSNNYYKERHFVPFPTSNGKIIWCDQSAGGMIKHDLEKLGVRLALPDDPEVIAAAGVNIEQDGQRKGNVPGQEYYFIGEGMAWTTRIRTCTALGIYDEVTGCSFLCHADAGPGNKNRIIQHLNLYLKMVPDQNAAETLTIHVFTASDTQSKNGESLKDVIGALTACKLKSDQIIHVGPEDTVAVFAGGPAKRLKPLAELLIDALDQFGKTQASRELQIIAQLLAKKPSLANDAEVYEKLLMCFYTLEEKGADSSFFEKYLTADDVKKYKRKPKEKEASTEKQTQSGSSLSLTTFAPYDRSKKWADYSDDEENDNKDDK